MNSLSNFGDEEEQNAPVTPTDTTESMPLSENPPTAETETLESIEKGFFKR